MEEKLIERLEAAVARLEKLSTRSLAESDANAASAGPSVAAFSNLMDQYLANVSSAAEKIERQVLDVTKILQEAFEVQKDLLTQVKQTQLMSVQAPPLPSKTSMSNLPVPPPLPPRISASNVPPCPPPSKNLISSIPTPPPPPPPAIYRVSAESSPPSLSVGVGGMVDVCEELKSKDVTAGLKKVTDDMKTKNRGGFVCAHYIKRHTASASFSNIGTPKFELQADRMWLVENQIGKRKIVIDDCDAKQSVYVYGCKDSILHIRGKVNNITMVNCTKLGVVFRDIVAACEIVNCNDVEVQCEGSAPTIAVDNTSGCQLYLSKDSLETSITTAKSSEINVMVPGDEPDSDWEEHALPQQYIHKFKDGRFVSTPLCHFAA